VNISPPSVTCREAPPEQIQPLSDREIHRAARQRLVAVMRPCWAHRGLLFRSAVYGLIFTSALVFLLPARYQSTARLMPPESATSANLALLSVPGGTANLASDLLGIKSSGALFVGVLGSESVQDAIIDRFDLRKVYSCKTYRMARRELTSQTSVSEDRKSGIITVQVSDRNPARAAGIAKAYLEELDRVISHLSTSAARRERIFLEERLQAVKQELDSAQRQLSEFSSQNVTIDIREQGRSLVQAGAKLQGDLIAGQAELKGLQQMYGEENVRVRAVRARIGEIQRELLKFSGNPGDAASFQPSGAVYPPLRRLPILGATYVDLARKTQMEGAVYEVLTRQYEIAKVQEAKEIPTVRVLDLPKVPEDKTFPPRLLLVASGAFLGFVAGLLRIGARHFWAAADTADPVRKLALEVHQDTREFWNSDMWRKIGLRRAHH
jgi:capsule polysaccharide export protein KpsE/RkpR